MAIENTLSIIKPDATRRNLTGSINAIFEQAGLNIVAQKRLQLTKSMAERFYEVHKDRPFFNDLVNFMVSGPVIVQVLRGENAVKIKIYTPIDYNKQQVAYCGMDITDNPLYDM